MVGPETEKGLDNEHDSDQSNLIIKPKVQFVQHFISCHSKHWIPLSMLMLLLQACCSESSGVRTVLLMGNTDPCLLRWFKSQNSYLTYSTILCVGSHVCHFGCFYGCIHIYTGCIYICIHLFPTHTLKQCLLSVEGCVSLWCVGKHILPHTDPQDVREDTSCFSAWMACVRHLAVSV